MARRGVSPQPVPPAMWAHRRCSAYSIEGESWFGFEAVRGLDGLPEETSSCRCPATRWGIAGWRSSRSRAGSWMPATRSSTPARCCPSRGAGFRVRLFQEEIVTTDRSMRMCTTGSPAGAVLITGRPEIGCSPPTIRRCRPPPRVLPVATPADPASIRQDSGVAPRGFGVRYMSRTTSGPTPRRRRRSDPSAGAALYVLRFMETLRVGAGRANVTLRPHHSSEATGASAGG